MKEYISAEEKAKQILKEINKDSPYTETRELSQEWILACITKGLQEFALGKDGSLLIIYKVVLSTAKRRIKVTGACPIRPAIMFEQDEVGQMGVEYTITILFPDGDVLVHTDGVGSLMKHTHLPDKTIIELADYIRSRTN
tara:strand:- start:7066 stop:7485 length:420 start_codon:yes stop_codon:yes gene_type:complete